MRYEDFARLSIGHVGLHCQGGEFTRDGREDFFADEKTQMAIIRAYEIIGEIAKRIPDDLLDQQPQAEWKQIKGFRDFLAHNYDEVIMKIVWGAVEKLPILRAAVESILKDLPTESDEDL